MVLQYPGGVDLENLEQGLFHSPRFFGPFLDCAYKKPQRKARRKGNEMGNASRYPGDTQGGQEGGGTDHRRV